MTIDRCHMTSVGVASGSVGDSHNQASSTLRRVNYDPEAGLISGSVGFSNWTCCSRAQMSTLGA